MIYFIIMKTVKIVSFTLIFAFFAGCTHKKARNNAYFIDDFSRLNRTAITGRVEPESYQELASIVKNAQKTGTKLSVAGSLHSQGGHAFYTHNQVMSLKKLNKILDFDPINSTITVQAGATWKTVQEYLQKNGYAVNMSSEIANVFTLGGALSVNANGIDPHRGPIIESVQSLKIMLANGTIITASRTENSELFRLAIGGYGLFGIILQATLRTVKNDLYRRESRTVSLAEYAACAQQAAYDQQIRLHFGMVKFTPHGDKLFAHVTAVDYYHVDATQLSKRSLKKLNYMRHDQGLIRYARQFGLALLRKTRLAQVLRIPLDESSDGAIRSRNFIFSPPVSQVYVKTPKETDLLQEYFVPVSKFEQFMRTVEHQARAYRINLMHAELRYIRDNQENFLPYTRGDVIGIVLFFTHKLSPEPAQRVADWTRA